MVAGLVRYYKIKLTKLLLQTDQDMLSKFRSRRVRTSSVPKFDAKHDVGLVNHIGSTPQVSPLTVIGLSNDHDAAFTGHNGTLDFF